MVIVFGFLIGCSGFGVSAHHVESQNRAPEREIYIARVSDFWSAPTHIRVIVNGYDAGLLGHGEALKARASYGLNALTLRAEGTAAEFYPHEAYRFSMRGRFDAYFLIRFKHTLTSDQMIIEPVDRQAWLDLAHQFH